MSVSEYIQRGAKRAGLQREFFQEKNIPTLPSNVLVVPFFGDMRSSCILSSFIMKGYKELRNDKYIIMCTWPGWRGLFPYVDEFWSMTDQSVTKTLASGAINFYNVEDLATVMTKNLIESFDIITHKELSVYYQDGFTKQFWSDYKEVKRFLPEIHAANRISEQFKKDITNKPGSKVVVYPVLRGRTWQKGKLQSMSIPKAFWSHLFQRLLDEGYTPVSYQNSFTYDMSKEFAGKCIYLVPKDISDVLSAMHYIGCTLDVFSGISNLSLIARTPYLALDERERYYAQGDYQIDELFCEVPKQHMFAFGTMMLSGTTQDWDASFLDGALIRLKEFLPSVQGKAWLPTSELDETLSYERVKERKAKRIGAYFVRSKYK